MFARKGRAKGAPKGAQGETMRFRRDESGQMLVLTALSLVALLGFMALAVDVGLLFRAKRQVQTAADAGAIAGALEYSYNGTTNIGSVAGTSVTNNGVTLSYTPSLNTGCPSTTANCAIVNTSSITGYHNTPGYVQVIAVQPNPTFFMGMFGTSNVRVSASAIAGIEPNPDCLITLDPTSGSSFWIKGNSNIDTPNCGIHVNSDSTTAVCVQGSASINGPYLKINGHQNGSGKCGKNPGAPVYNGAGPATDPFGDLLGPNPLGKGGNPADNSCTSGASGNTYAGTTLDGGVSGEVTTFNTAQGNATLWPTGNANSNATNGVTCFSGNVTLQNITLGPGIYVFENGVNIGNGVVVNGGTIDNYNGTLTNQNGTLKITAPASKTYVTNAIAIMQPAYNTTAQCQDPSIKHAINTTTCLQVQFGSSNEDLVGYIYAPTATVYLQDEGGGVTAAGVIADDFYTNSQLTITNNYNFLNPSTTPLSTIALVE